MTQSIFYLKKLTSAEVGTTKAHVGGYIRLPNDFDYELFFQSQGSDNNGVTEIIFNAFNLNKGIVEQNLRFAYFGNSNNERRIPNLGKLYKENNVEEGDVVRLESRINDGVAEIFIQFFKNSDIRTSASSIFYVSTKLEQSYEVQNNKTLQQIFYGAPGTGKSFTINNDTRNESVIRTTFHPDSDYSTFVGAYKPTMESAETKVVPVVVNYGISLDQNNGTYTESKITYKFVKQAFLKAYLAAWKKYAEAQPNGFTQQSVELSFKGEKWILTEMNDVYATYVKQSEVNISKYEKGVKETWNNILSSDDPDNYTPGNTERYATTACVWYMKENGMDHTADECWGTVLKELKSGKSIESTPGVNQKYTVTLNNDTIVVSSAAKAKKTTINDNYKLHIDSSSGTSVQKAIAIKLQGYGCDSFEKAWQNLKNEVFSKPSRQYLVIEEINRGNCAQIFGDIFQLLDRQDSGFSAYPIEADTDIQNAIKTAFSKEKEYQLEFDLNVDDAIKDYKSNYDSTLSKDIQEGRVLLLPPNLYIWATMNTSDQSLFPIDSAFKRRWDWVYIPIKEHKEENYKININGAIYDWWGFLEKINKVIGDVTSSEDKKLGYFFVNAPDKVVDAKKFVGKVLFYLWNDVFKNYGFENAIFSKGEKEIFTFSDFFDKNGEPNTKEVNDFLKKLDETIDKEHSFVKTDEENNVPSYDLIVKYEGEEIEGDYANSKYFEIVRRVCLEKGPEVVANCVGDVLTQTPAENSTRKYKEIENTGWYLATNIGKDAIKTKLIKIHESLGVDIVIE